MIIDIVSFNFDSVSLLSFNNFMVNGVLNFNGYVSFLIKVLMSVSG